MKASWFIVNILAPVFLPIMGIVPLKFLTLGTTAPPNLKLIALVKDAQLCWAAVAMGLSSLYEAALLLQKSTDVLIYLLLIILLMLPSMVLAAAGAVFSTPFWSPAGATVRPTFWALCGHYRAFVASCVLCVLTAVAYTVLHFGF